MKLNVTIVDEDTYETFIEKIQEQGISLKEFINKAIDDYVNGKPPKPPVKKYSKADLYIIELAIQQLEHQAKFLPKKIPAGQVTDYSYVSKACIELLKLVDTPLAKRYLKEFDQETAIHYLDQILQ